MPTNEERFAMAKASGAESLHGAAKSVAMTPDQLAAYTAAAIAAHTAKMLEGVEPVAWFIADSQGFYEPRSSEMTAQDFCERYNAREGDPLKPYSYSPVYSAATVAALRAEVERLRVDAERYQWLRVGKGAGPKLDAAIDAARSAK